MTQKKFLQGMIKRNPDGFGFFIPDDRAHPDVYIPRHSMVGIMTNDRVMIQVEKEKGSDRFRGDIIKVTERGTKKMVGQFFPTGSGGLIRDDSKGWGGDLKIKKEDTMGAKEKQLVVVEVLSYPGESQDFTGRIIEVLGTSQDPLLDIRRVLVSNNIPSEFEPAVIKESERFGTEVTEDEMKNRRDLRAMNFITIDGATAKDFDDAIYVEANKEGFLLYVAIADVSHYVIEGGAIDKSAYERGTSVYFPNFVVPMLPEVLSNHLCSLNPNVPRLSLVAEIQFNFSGEPLRSNFYEAVILSKARVTYGEAQEIIEGQSIEKLNHVAADILRASDLAKILMALRFKNGSLDLEIPETQLVIDAGGNPVDITRSERLFAHRLIEEMMLAANVAVATFFTEQEIPAIYRIHEPPKEEAMRLLERYLHNFGGQIDLGKGLLQKRLTRALQEFDGRPEALILNILTLRSMSQAKYSENNVGHFGLGFINYTHFTSPIRRYPDLIVHRLLKNRILKNSRYRLMSEDELGTAGAMLSACEQRSVKAERQLMSIKKARFMEKLVGQELDGVISSVTRFGVFVLLRVYEVDGLVRLEDLSAKKNEKFEFDEDVLQLVSLQSGLRYCIGDTIKIRVASVDVEAGQINFVLAGAPAVSPEAHKNQARSNDQRPRSPQQQRGGRNDRDNNRSNDRSRGSQRSDRTDRSQRSDRRQDEDDDANGSKANHPKKKKRSFYEKFIKNKAAKSGQNKQSSGGKPKKKNKKR